jgi:hypothetical protein
MRTGSEPQAHPQRTQCAPDPNPKRTRSAPNAHRIRTPSAPAAHPWTGNRTECEADHCLAPTAICSAALPDRSGLILRELLVDFFTSTERM